MFYACEPWCQSEGFPPNSSPYQVFTRFVYYFYQHFSLIRLFQKIYFQSKTNFFFQIIARRFWFWCFFVYVFLRMCFLGCFFTVLPSWDYKQLHIIYVWLPIWPLIKSCGITKEFMAMIWKLQTVVVFLVSEETKFEVDTTSIVLSCL